MTFEAGAQTDDPFRDPKPGDDVRIAEPKRLSQCGQRGAATVVFLTRTAEALRLPGLLSALFAQ
jgi:hypothetical protein